MNIEQREAVGRYWFGAHFRWEAASAEEKAVVESQMREHASNTTGTSSSDARAAAKTIAESVQRFVRRCLATRDARITGLEDRIATLEGEKSGKPHIKLRAISGRDD
jgi:hypothetical protein